MSDRPPEDAEPAGAYVDALADGADTQTPSMPLTDEEQARLERVARVFADVVAMEPDDVEALLASDDVPPRPLLPPTLPEDYELIREIGHGGMGVVYKARQASLDRTVAVKVLHPSDRLFGHAIRRFQQEARLLARLRHPNIVSIHEVGEVEGQVYFTMEWIDGRPMSALLEEGRLTPARAASILRQVAAAVAYVHDHGLIHRDLKPANILIDDADVVYVTDFGLALELESDAGLTLTGQIVGTPAYMSPEQARGRTEDVSAASDVYALGVILYECLTGRRPFAGRSPAEQVYAVIHEDPLRPRRIDARIPEDLQVIGMKAMSKRPSERYDSARAMLEDLERFEAGRPIRARPPSRSYRLGRWARRNHGHIGWAAAGLAALALILVTMLPTKRSTENPALGAIAADLEADGHLDAALRLQEQAVKQTDPPDRELHDRLTQLRLRVAKGYWETGEPARAVSLLEHAYAEGLRLYGEKTWKYVGPVAWALATARALADPAADATPDFRSALEVWKKQTFEEATRLWRAGGPPPTGPHHNIPIARAIVDAVLPDLTSEARPARMSAIRQVIALTEASHLSVQPITWLVAEVPERGALLMRSVLDIALAAELHRPGLGAWALGSLQGPVRAVAAPSVEQALATVASAEDADPLVRRSAALLLLDIANIPIAGGFLASEPRRAEVDPDAVVAVWNDLRALDPKEAYRRRVRIAAQEMARVAAVPQGKSNAAGTAYVARQWLPIWFRAHTGVQSDTAAQMRVWLDEHGDEDPRQWLARALSIPGTPNKEDAPGLLGVYASNGPRRRGWIHNLLRLIVPAEKESFPAVGLQRAPARDLLPRWRNLVHDSPPAGRLRLARLAFREGRWHLDPQAEARSPVAVGQSTQMSHEGPLQAFASSAVQVSLPGLLARPGGGQGTRYLRVQADLAWGNEGLELRIAQMVRGMRGAGSSRSNSRRGRAVQADYAMSPDLRLGGWSHPDHFRHEFSLLALEPEDSPDTPWTLADWQTRLAEDWQHVADETTKAEKRGQPGHGIDPGYRFLMDRQHTIMGMGAIASRLPLPAAVDALRIVEPRLRDLDSQRRLVAFARLMAGDETALDDKTSVASLESLDDDGYTDSTAGRAGEAWIRLLRLTQSERIGAFALKRLEALKKISARAAGDLLDAKRRGQVTLPAWLEERLAEGPVEDRSWWGLVKDTWPAFAGVALLLLGSLLALVFVLRPRRAPGQGLVPAAWLVVLGVVMGSLHVFACGFDHLPDPLGYGLAALGAALLAREAKSARRFLPALLFAAAGLLELLRHTFPLPPLLSTLEAACAALGVILLPGLARQLRGSVPRAVPAPAEPLPPLRRHLWILAAIVLLLLLLVNLGGRGGSNVAILAWGALLFGTYALARGLVWLTTRPRSPRLLPIAFWLFYILPIGFVLVVTLWIQISGEGELQIKNDWLGPLLVIMWICVLWALNTVVLGARIRKAWLRMRSAPTV